MATNTALNSFLRKINEIYPQIEKKYHINSLEVFGSFSRGEQKEGSDLDLLVTFSEPPSLFGFVRLENYLSDTLGVKVDLVMKDSLKPHISERVLAATQSTSSRKVSFQKAMEEVLEKNAELYRRLAS